MSLFLYQFNAALPIKLDGYIGTSHETILSIHETTINCCLIGLNIDAKFILKKLIFLAPTGALEMLVFVHPSRANLSRSLNLHLSGLDLQVSQRVFKRVFKLTSSGPK